MVVADQLQTESIDGLMPSPRPWWVRLAVAATLLVGVGYLGYLWGFGFLRPNPDCCGSGSALNHLSVTEDGTAVVLAGHLYNASPAEVIVTDARIELAGAEVLEIHPIEDDADGPLVPIVTTDFPVGVDGHEFAGFAIVFRPTSCTERAVDGQWGWLTVDLATPDRWYPTFGRTYELAEPLVQVGHNDFVVLPPAGREDAIEHQEPLAAACALLGR